MAPGRGIEEPEKEARLVTPDTEALPQLGGDRVTVVLPDDIDEPTPSTPFETVSDTRATVPEGGGTAESVSEPVPEAMLGNEPIISPVEPGAFEAIGLRAVVPG